MLKKIKKSSRWNQQNGKKEWKFWAFNPLSSLI
jgi:hypothetical protein